MLRRLMPIFLVASPQAAGAQSVPEGVHQNATGPAEICGLSARDAEELAQKVRTAPHLRPVATGSSRFDAYDTADGLTQFVVTRPSEPAHPAVTCREGYQEDGAWMTRRTMRCDAGREACDKLFLEFQEVDEQLRKHLTGR